MRHALVLILLALPLAGQPKKEDPVGLILIPGGGKVVRAGTETMLAAKSGDVLFSGDSLKGEGAATSFLFCPTKSSYSLGAAIEVQFDAKQVKVKSGKLADPKPVGSCFLPQVVRVSVASQQHYGVSMTRSVPDTATLTPREKLPPAVQEELKTLEQQAAANAEDLAPHVAMAALYEQNDAPGNALAEYRKIAAGWKDAVWVRGKIFELEEKMAAATPPPAAGEGQTFALLVGVSQYQKLPKELWLNFAHADAQVFDQHFRSPRGGGVPAANIRTLTNEGATTAALRNAFQTLIKGRAGKKDTVFILMAGHGTVELPGSKKAFILTYDSDPQDLAATGLPMEELQNLVQEQLSSVGRVALFVDVCRAGTIGTIKSTTVNSSVERLAEAEGELMGFMASRPKELSYEGQEFGGGHGAFSYFLLKGLNGAADKSKDGIVNVNELIDYVRAEVATATSDKQHPRDFGNLDNAFVLADTRKPGIPLARRPVLMDLRNGEPLYLASMGDQDLSASQPDPVEREFDEALRSRRLGAEAAEALRRAESRVPRQRFEDMKSRLRVALENGAQQVVLRYLTGDQVPQRKEDFAEGARLTDMARRLTPESVYLDARQSFFQGRAMLFDKQYPQATDLLERAVRLDGAGAYAYNALGIAYLEQADYTRAIQALRDAARLAPHWAYPLHNLALTYQENGNSAAAIRTYQQAMRLMPEYSYLPYNLGLVYQRANRRKDAELMYRRAIQLAPETSEPYNALGSLQALQGKRAEAERLYREALAKDPSNAPAKHNLALLFWESKDRKTEALAAWKENIAAHPDFIASRVSLAEALNTGGQPAEALAAYREIVRLKPDYIGARLAIARLLVTGNKPAEASVELEKVRASSGSENAELLELLGDVAKAQGKVEEAKSYYRQAKDRTTDRQAKKRLTEKQKD